MILINFMGEFCNFSSLIFFSFPVYGVRAARYAAHAARAAPRRATRRLEFVNLPYTALLAARILRKIFPKKIFIHFLCPNERFKNYASLLRRDSCILREPTSLPSIDNK